MVIFNKRETFLLFVGDLAIFAFSLWLSFLIRDGQIPTFDTYKLHIVPFAIIFLAWTLVFFIAGLYEKYTTILKNKISGTIFNAQLVNSAVAIAFFYLIPSFGITPKTLLFVDLVISLFLIYLWRIYSHPLFGLKSKTPAII